MKTITEFTLRDPETNEVVFKGFAAEAVEAGVVGSRKSLDNAARGKPTRLPYSVEIRLVKCDCAKVEKSCKLCGKTIVTNAHTHYCPECRKKARQQTQKKFRSTMLSRRKLIEHRPRRSADWADPVTLKQREVDTYNAAHGTHWSYGQYVGGRR